MYWESKGKLVPTRELIKTPEQIEGIRKSGVVNTGCLDAVAESMPQSLNGLADILLNIFTMNAGGIIPKINGILMATSACPIRFSGDF